VAVAVARGADVSGGGGADGGGGHDLGGGVDGGGCGSGWHGESTVDNFCHICDKLVLPSNFLTVFR
jgi:hypothetical protein